VLTRNQDWESEFAAFKPSEKRAELRDELLALYHEQDETKKEVKRQKKAQKSATNAQSAGTASAAPAPPSSSAPAQPAGPHSKASSPVPPPLPQKLLWQPVNVPEELLSSTQTAKEEQSTAPTPVEQLVHQESQGDELETALPRALPEPDAINRAAGSDERSISRSRGIESAHPDDSDEDPMLEFDPNQLDSLNTVRNVDASPLKGLEDALSQDVFRPMTDGNVAQPARSSS